MENQKIVNTPYGKEIDEHMKKQFPERKERVFYEQNSEFLQIEIHLLEAPTKKDFHVLYTVGMSALPMTLPEDLLPEYQALERAEILLLLPAEWSLFMPEDGKVDNRLWWPVNLMKYLSYFPHENKTWLAFGHTLPNSEAYEPYDDSTKLCGVMLGALQEEISILRGKDGTQINLYPLIPLYKEEIEGKQEEGTEALITRLSTLNGFGMIVFPDRPNVWAK
ncbi:suppressor of fused protein (SUFU) [Anaerotignum neopropionicum]|uniref:Suppressor of fused protein (SUFU) n=1 Tax=Anaerotignum neopropionicum TaxID=36847 RepID=A0A136WD74_9FIRM|nr:suppressor of fused domain protein [Anaerotignum neopropionicum]KXL52458.1 suppressor of fused protein (SUFU) [Anaerotignum neopropionicum]